MSKFKIVGIIFVLTYLFNSASCQVPFQSLSCEFSGSPLLCKWTSTSNPWTLRLASSSSMNIQFSGPAKPPYQKTNFIQVIGKNDELLSPIVSSKSSTDCFSFYYYIHGEGAGSIQLELLKQTGRFILWQRRYSAGDMWHTYNINIGPQETSFRLKFVVDSGSGAVGLTAFTGSNDMCFTSSVCDFEIGNCNWTSTATNPNYIFKLTKASDSPIIDYDHSTDTGYGHLMEATGGNTGDSTNLTSPNFHYYSAPFCLRFWYWRHLSQVNKIEVITKSALNVLNTGIVWTSENRNFTNKVWHRAQVDFFMNYQEQLIIRATRLATTQSSVDIDDINLLPQKCPLPIDCDFNDDMCGWTRDLDQNWIWDHGIGRLENAKTLQSSYITIRPVDRMAPDDGMFMFTDFSTKKDSSTAKMIMTSEYVNATTGSCLSFYYLPLQFNTPSTQFDIITVDFNGNKNTIKTLMANLPISKTWTKMQVNIQSSQSFRIIFQVITTSPSTYLGIDDTTYRAGACNGGVLPTTIKPIVSTLLPSLTLSCNFEAGTTCNWKDSAIKVGWWSSWTVTTANIGSSTDQLLPRIDHSTNSIYGHYAYLSHKASDQNNLRSSKRAIMRITNNGVTGASTSPFCFTLWYFMRTTVYVELNVTITTPDDKLVNAVSRQNGQGEKWNMLQFETPGDKNGYIYSIYGLAQFGVLAIDDITVVHQPCQQADPSVFRCTFEGGHNCSFIATYQALHLNLNWNVSRGTDTYIQTYDHTLKTKFGHYYALDFHTLAKISLTTTGNYEIVSKKFPPTPQACVTFSYFMSKGNMNESLNFYVITSKTLSPRPLWTAFGDLGMSWFSHRVTVSSELEWQIGFDVTTHNSNQGLIAIDDVIVQLNQKCPPKGFCDFERKDTCMWESILPQNVNLGQGTKQSWANIAVNQTTNLIVLTYTDFEWTVHSPDYFIDPFYPSIDHTLSRKSGNYLLLKALTPRQVGDRAILVSDHYDIDTNRSFCFKLYFYIKNQNSGSSRFEVYQAENYNNYKKIGQVIGTTSSTNWTEFKVTAKAMSARSKNMWFYLIGDVGTLGSVIAIDDISITSGDCLGPQNDIFICLPSTQVVPKKLRCDGHKDCVNGADELDCGSCDFSNNDKCGFKEFVPADPLGYQFRMGNYSTGPRSGPYGHPHFLIAQAYRYSSAIETTEIYTPDMYHPGPGCYVSFQYNINGSMNHPIPAQRWSHLSIILKRISYESTEIWNSDVLNFKNNMWTKGQASIGRVYGMFSITYRAKGSSSSGAYGYVALANIQMSSDCRIVPNAQCVPNSLYTCCKNGRYVSKQYLCDFNDDCGDNSDEASCTNYPIRCDFENGLCNWGRYEKGGWNLESGTYTLSAGPTRDHTKGIRTGKFLIYRDKNSISSALSGPTLQPTSNCRMRFWYSMEGNTSSSGSVSIVGVNLLTRAVITFWKSYPSQFPQNVFSFVRQDISINGMSGPFRIYIIGALSAGNSSPTSSYIAVDDISFTPQCILSTSTLAPGQSSTSPRPIVTSANPCSGFTCKTSKFCIDRSKVCNFYWDCDDGSDEKECGKCGFEQTDSLGRPYMCGWHNTGLGMKQWVARSGTDMNSYNGNLPMYDSTRNKTGKYLVIDTSSGGTANYPAVLMSTVLGATASTCKLTFAYTHYYPFGSKATLAINLYKRQFSIFTKNLYTITSNLLDWMNYTINIGQMEPGYQIQITGNSDAPLTNTRPYIDMSLDELQFVDCNPVVPPVSTLNCDFEVGTCGWYDWNMASSNKIDWIRTRSQSVEPGFDHTSRLRPRPFRYGTWIYTQRSFGMIGNNTATLMTTAVQPTTTTPKCLTFWYHLFGRESANFSLLINTAQSPFSANPRALWVKKVPQSNNWVQAQVTIQPQSQLYYLMFRASLIALSLDTIALDDISYTEGACPSTSICDFEVNYCNWQMNVPGAFLRASPLSITGAKIPSIDHTLGAPDGNYIKVNIPNQDVILSYTIPTSISANHTLPITYLPRPMCLKLWYYMGSPPSVTQGIRDYFNVSKTIFGSLSQFNFGGVTAPTLRMFNNLNQWLYKRVNMYIAVNEVVSITAGITSPYSVVAFDDIQIQKQACEQPGWCDFENDFCGYSNALPTPNTRRVIWLRNSGKTDSYMSGPKRDHTTDTEDGWYVYVSEDAQKYGVAVLQSEYVGPFNSPICFGFYYHILSKTATTSARLKVQYWSPYIPRLEPKLIANLSSSNQDRWIKFSVTLNPSNTPLPQGRFQFITYQGQTLGADVALDDITIQAGACDQPTPSTTNNPMTTSEPIPNQQWNCNFETTSCKWRDTLGAGWKIMSWANNNNIGPRVDHTIRTAFGHYLLYDGSQTAGKPLQYTSDPVTDPYKTGTQACFSFWYYIDTESKFNLTFGSYFIPMHKTSGSFASRQWKQVQGTINLISEMRLSIQLERNPSLPFIGTVAIDDIKLSMGQCKYDTGVECDFSVDYCGYQVIRKVSPQLFGSSGIGYITDILTKTQKFGPQTDHTTGEAYGFYFWFTKPIPLINGTAYETQLIINNLPVITFKPQCLKFWYQINTPTIYSFYIYVTPTTSVNYFNPSWTVPYNNFNQWTRGQLTITARFLHKIVFSLNMPRLGNNSFIALDDISLTPGACEAPVSCDFDNDLCSWANIRTQLANTNWAKFTAPPGINQQWFGPSLDHTLRRNGGSYLYLTLPQNSFAIQRTAVIESMIQPLKTPKCLTLWIQLIGDDPTIEVFVVRYGNNVPLSNQTHSLSQPLMGPKTNWTELSFTIDPNHFPNTTVFSIRIRGKVSVYKSFVALDDIYMSEGVCPNVKPNIMFCKGPNPTQYDVSKRCDFVYDCPLHEDEDNCGNCDFEKDTCLWMNKDLISEQWVRKAATNRSAPSGPIVDGQTNAQGHYMIVNSDTRMRNRADLMRNNSEMNILKKSYFRCQMSFNYFINTTATKRNTTFFTITVGSNIRYARTVWRMNDQGLNKWTPAVARIGDQDAEFRVDFLGALTGQASILAIDDIKFQNCGRPAPSTSGCAANQFQCKNKVCVSSDVLCDNLNDCGDRSDELRDSCNLKVKACTFESNLGGQANCNWTQEWDTVLATLWSPIKSSTANTNQNMLRMTGPTFDHTYRLANLGTFLALQGQRRDYGKKTRFVTQMVTSTPQKTCAIRLFYYMFGSQIGSLSISVRYSDPNIKSNVNPIVITGNQGQQWKRVVLAVSDQRPFQFIIEGQVGLGDIAIDDISFSQNCLPSNAKPGKGTTSQTVPSKVTPTNVTPTKSINLNKSSSGGTPKSNSGKIAAGVLVPIFVIGAVLAFFYYRRYHQRKTEEDRADIVDHVHYSNDTAETSFDRKDRH